MVIRKLQRLRRGPDTFTRSSHDASAAFQAITAAPGAITEAFRAFTVASEAITESFRAITGASEAITDASDAITEAFHAITEERARSVLRTLGAFSDAKRAGAARGGEVFIVL
ncbi:hypothetical protein AY599_00180 [Leptolyngbya valderiana BDU 20041]|nr:hypothetical protein AY599_00180 [Leptolyngbya valderiana BDU 20041]